MATVIERERPVERSSYIERDSGSGWAVAAVILIAVLAVGAFMWARYYQAPAATQTQTPGANINVTLPQAGGSSDNGTGGNTSGNASGNTTPTPTGGTQIAP